jgi:hypothetical protein
MKEKKLSFPGSTSGRWSPDPQRIRAARSALQKPHLTKILLLIKYTLFVLESSWLPSVSSLQFRNKVAMATNDIHTNFRQTKYIRFYNFSSHFSSHHTVKLLVKTRVLVFFVGKNINEAKVIIDPLHQIKTREGMYIRN